MNIQTLKGFRDFLPKEAKKRQYAINTLKSVFECYGFEPLETPTLEYEEILTGKYGEEGDKLMYRFEDNGKRKVAMRYDQTVPLARVVAQYQNELPRPFKRYQIQNVWRADNTQKGRFREFLQCDIDTVGTTSSTSDAEILALIFSTLSKLGFKNFKILINDRAIFKDLKPDAITIIDKLKKIGSEKVKEELREKGYNEETLDMIQNAAMTEQLTQIEKEAVKLGANKDTIVFEPTLARGLDYYTGIIIEIEIDGYAVGSVGGGGRYDNLIGMFLNKEMPAVGFAFGFDRIIEAMNEQNLFPEVLPDGTEVLVTIFSPELANASLELSTKLRSKNINTELWLDPMIKMEKQLKYADQKNIPFVVIVGPEENEKNMVTLKNMKTREQKQLTLDEATSTLSSL